MANNVIGLFENEAIAESVVEELVAHGFNRSVIKRFRGNNDQLEDELRREGIPADEASYYVNGLNEGGALVSVRAEESETDSAVDVMNRYVNTGQSDAAAAESAASDASFQGSAAGWDDSDSSKGVAAAGTDYDGAGAAASSSGLAVGRDAYASYTKRAPAPASEAPQTSAPSMGFPVGREAYASYTKRAPAAESTESRGESEPTSGFAVGRAAYEAYNRERAQKSSS